MGERVRTAKGAGLCGYVSSRGGGPGDVRGATVLAAPGLRIRID